MTCIKTLARNPECGSDGPRRMLPRRMLRPRLRGERHLERIEAPTLVLVGEDNPLADRQAGALLLHFLVALFAAGALAAGGLLLILFPSLIGAAAVLLIARLISC